MFVHLCVYIHVEYNAGWLPVFSSLYSGSSLYGGHNDPYMGGKAQSLGSRCHWHHALPLRWNSSQHLDVMDALAFLKVSLLVAFFHSLSVALAGRWGPTERPICSGSSPHLLTLLTLQLKINLSYADLSFSLFLWNSPWNVVELSKELVEKSPRQTDPSSDSLSGHLEEVWGEWRGSGEAVRGRVRTVRSLWVWVWIRDFRGCKKWKASCD